jgi:hypothetical protein
MLSSIFYTIKRAVGYDQPTTATAKEARALTQKYTPLNTEAKKSSLYDPNIQLELEKAIEKIKAFSKELEKLSVESYQSDKNRYTHLQNLQESLKNERLNQSFYRRADAVKNCVYTVAGGLTPGFVSSRVVRFSTEHPYLVYSTTFMPRMIAKIGYHLAKFAHKTTERSLQSLKNTIVENTPRPRKVVRLALDASTAYLSLNHMQKDPTAPLPYFAVLTVLLARRYF